jgi:hypothetical protein
LGIESRATRSFNLLQGLKTNEPESYLAPSANTLAPSKQSSTQSSVVQQIKVEIVLFPIIVFFVAIGTLGCAEEKKGVRVVVFYRGFIVGWWPLDLVSRDKLR